MAQPRHRDGTRRSRDTGTVRGDVTQLPLTIGLSGSDSHDGPGGDVVYDLELVLPHVVSFTSN